MSVKVLPRLMMHMFPFLSTSTVSKKKKKRNLNNCTDYFVYSFRLRPLTPFVFCFDII